MNAYNGTPSHEHAINVCHNTVVRSRDDQEVGVAHKVKSPDSIFPDNNGIVLVR